MPAASPTELVAPPEGARLFTLTMWPGLGDCAPTGRIRLDALARWLQDVAYADVEAAGLADSAHWVVRRNRLRIRRWPRFAERFSVTTFCSGLGRMWAERRTSVRAADAAPGEPSDLEAVALWVHLDPLTRRPFPFTSEEVAAYGDFAAGRRISARLRHPAPAPDLPDRTWRFRWVDCDIAGHLNNAAYWEPLEEELLDGGREPDWLDAEIEFRRGAQPGEARLLSQDGMRWILDPAGELVASVALDVGSAG